MKQWKETETPSKIMSIAEESAYSACHIEPAYYYRHRSTRRSEIITIQQIAILLIRQNCPFSVTTVGDFFGICHSNVSHHVKTCLNLLSVDKNYKKIYNKAKEIFSQNLARIGDNN